jgi:hypothetical protein
MINEMMENLVVGGKWRNGVTPCDAPVFNYTPVGADLLLFFSAPDKKEVDGARSGKIEMGYYIYKSVIFLVFKINGMGGWMDCPFSIRKYDGTGMSFDWSEDIGPDLGIGITIILVDRDNEQIKSIRMIGANHKFSVGLRNAIIKQMEMDYSESQYNQEINEVYKNLNSEDIAIRAENMFRIS